MKNFLLSALMVLSVAGVSEAAATDSVTVAGKISGSNGVTTLLVNECDISECSVRRVAETDSNGYFRTTIPLSYPHTFTVNFNRTFINAFAEPGDSIFVDIDASSSPIAFRLSGDKAEINEAYSHAFSELSGVYYGIRLPADTTALAAFMPVFRHKADSCLKIVNAYVESHAIPEEAAELLRINNIYSIANLACGYRGRSQEERKAFFTDPIFNLADERNTRVMIYPYHLNVIAGKFPETIAEFPKGTVRDILYVASGNPEIARREDFYNPEYFDRVYNRAPEKIDIRNLNPDSITIYDGKNLFTLHGSDPIAWLREKIKNRPIYLDISATWCGPCRAALASSGMVREYFKDKGPVFVIVWLKSDMEEWQEIAPTIHNALQIFIPDEDTANIIMGDLQVHGFPSYYLIDRSGRITSEGVPHFNDPQLFEYLKDK